MKSIDVLVVGGGPAGLRAAIAAARGNYSILLCEREDRLGGQLAKQTHKFFGDASQCAGRRGIEIAKELERELLGCPNVEVWLSATVQGWFKEEIITCDYQGHYVEIKAKKVIAATGASEKFALFVGNDLPGVYGAGAVQTLMNVYGVRPAKRVVMIGSGNIGLIVSYQLKQAGVDVLAVIEAADRIGGYQVHAEKIRRMGIPILTGHSIVGAYGNRKVERVVIAAVDHEKSFVPGTEKTYFCDCICLAVGLQPLAELCWQGGCEMKYVSELGGYVPIISEYMKTSKTNVFVAGDLGGIEEASTALVGGTIAGLSAILELDDTDRELQIEREDALEQLYELRAGPMGSKIRKGLQKMRGVGSCGRSGYDAGWIGRGTAEKGSGINI